MLILARLITPCRMVISQGDLTFNESQKLRISSTAYYKEAGEYLIQIRELLKVAKPSKPCETDLGVFRSFNHFLNEKAEECLGVSRRTAYSYIKLAENWDIVLKLGMQDISDDKLPNAMRVCRTLQVVSWYKKKVKAGADPDTLTLDLYWLEDKAKSEKSASEPYVEVVKERDYYKSQYESEKLINEEVIVERDYYKERCQILEEQLAATIN